MLLYIPISSPEHYISLQTDIDVIAQWVNINWLQFTKISRKKTTPVLKLIISRLLISHDLSWSRSICSKAKKLLGMLYCRFYQDTNMNAIPQINVYLTDKTTVIQRVHIR